MQSIAVQAFRSALQADLTKPRRLPGGTKVVDAGEVISLTLRDLEAVPVLAVLIADLKPGPLVLTEHYPGGVSNRVIGRIARWEGGGARSSFLLLDELDYLPEILFKYKGLSGGNL